MEYENYVNETSRLFNRQNNRSLSSFIRRKIYFFISMIFKLCWIVAGTLLMVWYYYNSSKIEYFLSMIIFNSCISLARYVIELISAYRTERGIEVNIWIVRFWKLFYGINISFYYVFIVVYIIFVNHISDAANIFIFTYIIVEYGMFLFFLLLLILFFRCGASICCPNLLINVSDIMPIRRDLSSEQVEKLNHCVFHDGKLTSRNNRDSHILHSDNFTCTICHDDYNHGDNIILLDCGHHYHKECCISWLNVNCICPYCRYEVKL